MNDRFTAAMDLLKAGKYPEAGKLFHELWDETGSAFAASRYIHCLRKAGHPQAACRVGKKALDQFPGNIWIRRELIWAHYDAYVKPAQQRGDLRTLLKAGETILALGAEDAPLRSTIKAVWTVAQKKQEWEIVADWCDRIAPSELSDEAPLIQGRRGKSMRERWYFARVKSLIQLQRWDEARSWAQEATRHYPREVNFPRWAALALAGQGYIEQAIAEMEELTLKRRVDWYVWNDLCGLYLRIGQAEAALRAGCQAALAPGEDKQKVTLYERLGQVGLSLGKLELAARQVALSKAIRQRERWPIRPRLARLEAEIRHALEEAGLNWPVDTDDIGDLAHLCQADWAACVYIGLPRKAGIVEALPQGKPHGWIRTDDGERIFFLQNDLPDAIRYKGARLEFALMPNWDRKYDRRSYRAVDFRALPD